MKASLKTDYLAGLALAYPAIPYGDPTSRPAQLAEQAVDAALAGKMKLEGAVWFSVLAAHGLPKSITRAQLAALSN